MKALLGVESGEVEGRDFHTCPHRKNDKKSICFQNCPISDSFVSRQERSFKTIFAYSISSGR